MTYIWLTVLKLFHPKGFKVLPRPRLGLNHLNSHKSTTVNTAWVYIRTKDKFDGPIFGGEGGGLYSGGKTLHSAVC